MLSPQSCLTLYDPKDCSPPGLSVHGIYSVLTKKEILPFATAWMNLEYIMLDEIS